MISLLQCHNVTSFVIFLLLIKLHLAGFEPRLEQSLLELCTKLGVMVWCVATKRNAVELRLVQMLAL